MLERSIHYTIVESCLGKLLIAATQKGVCLIRFGRSEERLCRELEDEFPYAPLRRNDRRLRAWGDALLLYTAGDAPRLRIPLDVTGSRFQRRVWDALRRIPRGETRSYSELAGEIGMPRGARAVARACATNRIPLLIPCHRVVAKDGSLGGYAFGPRRKRALLRAERD